MGDPIPDEVLRQMASWGRMGEGMFFSSAWPDPYRLASALLALRVAARALEAEMASEDYDTGAMARVRALLPEEPR